MTQTYPFHRASQSKPPFTRDRLTWLSYGMLIYYSYFQTILGPVLPFLRVDLHLSYGVAAWHFSAFGCGMIFAGLTAEVLSRHLGRAAIFWGGGGGVSVGGMFIALGHQVWMMLVGALAMGVTIQKAHVEGANRACSFALELGTTANVIAFAQNESFTPPY